MPTYRSITLSLISQFDILTIPEFAPPTTPNDPFQNAPTLVNQEDSMVSVYIPTYPASQFWLSYSISPPHPPKALYYFKLYLNGRLIVSWGCGEENDYKGKTMFGLFDVGSGYGKQPLLERRVLRFAPEPGESDNHTLGNFGNFMEVRVFRSKGRKRVKPDVQESPGVCGRLHAVQKGSQMQAEGGINLVNAGLLPAKNPKRMYNYALLDPLDHPFATFRYYYRTWDQLEALGVVSSVSSTDSSSTHSFVQADRPLTPPCSENKLDPSKVEGFTSHHDADSSSIDNAGNSEDIGIARSTNEASTHLNDTQPRSQAQVQSPVAYSESAVHESSLVEPSTDPTRIGIAVTIDEVECLRTPKWPYAQTPQLTQLISRSSGPPKWPFSPEGPSEPTLRSRLEYLPTTVPTASLKKVLHTNRTANTLGSPVKNDQSPLKHINIGSKTREPGISPDDSRRHSTGSGPKPRVRFSEPLAFTRTPTPPLAAAIPRYPTPPPVAVPAESLHSLLHPNRTASSTLASKESFTSLVRNRFPSPELPALQQLNSPFTDTVSSLSSPSSQTSPSRNMSVLLSVVASARNRRRRDASQSSYGSGESTSGIGSSQREMSGGSSVGGSVSEGDDAEKEGSKDSEDSGRFLIAEKKKKKTVSKDDGSSTSSGGMQRDEKGKGKGRKMNLWEEL